MGPLNIRGNPTRHQPFPLLVLEFTPNGHVAQRRQLLITMRDHITQCLTPLREIHYVHSASLAYEDRIMFMSGPFAARH